MTEAGGRLTSEVATQASLLVHHLLNQSLSGLDFCILWQELAQSHSELCEVDAWVQKFLETADLAHLDQVLVLLPEPASTKLPEVSFAPKWQEGWDVKSTRIRETTRLEMTCLECSWVIDLTLEHAANTEMRLPFEDLSCPICEQSKTDQGPTLS